MSKTAKLTLFVASSCLIIGIIFSVVAFALVGFDVRQLSSITGQERIHPVQNIIDNDDIQKISIIGMSEDYRIVTNDTTEISVEYYENDLINFTISEQGETLFIEENHPLALMLFNIDYENNNKEVTISIPATYAGSIELTTRSGRVTIEAGVRCEALVVTTLSGSIRCEEAYITSLSLKTTSGDISGNGLRTSEISFVTTSGFIQTARLEVSRLYISTVSGNVAAFVMGSQYDYVITTSSVTGTITAPLGNSQASKSIELETVSGSINLTLTE